MISTADGYHIWSESYDRQLDDIFEVQEEIALKIANRLREKLTLDPVKDSLIKIPTQNIEAYNTYLKGLFHLNKWTLDDTDIATHEFQKAIEMEPDFALPWFGLSSMNIYLGASGKRHPQDVYPKAKEFAQKAIQLDDRAAESHCALATAYFYYDWDLDKALQSLEKAIDLNPSFANAYLMKAMVYVVYGKTDLAIETMQKSIQLDPFSPPSIFAFAAILVMTERYKEALYQFDKLFEIIPHFPDALCSKGIAHQMLGQYETAEELFKMAEKNPGSEAYAYACRGSLYVAMNKPDKAREYLKKLLAAENSLPGQPVQACLANLYAAMDRPDEMFQCLNKSIEIKEGSALNIWGFPEFIKFRSDPRFTELLQKIGIKQ